MSRVTPFRSPHRQPASEPNAPRPPMGGARNEALGLLLILLILTLIAAAFFWQAARTRAAVPHPLTVRKEAAAVFRDKDGELQRAGSFSSVRETWSQTDIRSFRARLAERIA
ncbi:MAG TPA: hypothetical protein VHC69_18800 [Polyangiaceae bacterium]|nr:hypothetical protein [Polyangiaceae bacterium]